MTRTLLRGGVVHAADGRPATALATEGSRIVYVGDEDGAAAYDGADQVVDLGGRWVAPAFVDAHLHVVQLGESLAGLDLSRCIGAADLLDRLARHAALLPADQTVVGHGWDETFWTDRSLPTDAELEAAAPGRRVLVSRVDGHSAVASPALQAEVPGIAALDGYAGDGLVRRSAKHAISDRLGDLIGAQQRRRSARLALTELARLGVAACHDNQAPHVGPAYEVALVREEAAEVGIALTVYWGELAAFHRLDELGVSGLAGDLNADGALGSRTAALGSPYADADTLGNAYLEPRQIADHVVGCSNRGVQAGFHCIGDAALEAVGTGFRIAAAEVGPDAIRARRHRLEHAEMVSEGVLGMLAELGVVGSVQPRFDEYWGGPDRMYAERLGERWPELNRFADYAKAGFRLAFGSDAPVTVPSPWHAVRAAVTHRTPGQALTERQAFAAHTRGGWYAAGVDGAGSLAAGQRAVYAVWDVPRSSADGLPDLTDPSELPSCTRTVVDGRVIFDVAGVEKIGGDEVMRP